MIIEQLVLNEEEFEAMLEAEMASQESEEFYAFSEEAEELFDEIIFDFISL